MANFLALLCCAAGIGCLFGSWRQSRSRPLLVWTGWLLLFVSTIVWIVGSGAEFGVSYALMSISLFAWLAVLINFEVRESRQQKDKPAGELLIPDARTVSRHLLLFVATVPLAGAAAILASGLLSLLLPWEPVNSMAFTILLMPLLWGLAAYWASADSNILRPVLGLAAVAGFSALLIYA